MKKIIICHKKFLEWAYTMESYIFYRRVNPDQNDSDIELYQVVPDRRIKDLITYLDPSTPEDIRNYYKPK